MYLIIDQESSQGVGFDFSSYPSSSNAPVSVYNTESADNEFNDFEEDEMTKRIREE